MKIVIYFLILTVYAFSSNLLTYNIYDRTDRVDVMLSFDSPYEGKIYQKSFENKIVLSLEDLSFDRSVKRDIASNIVQSLEIVPDKNSLKVILKTDNKIGVIASKTTDGFGLRIRAKLLNGQKYKPITPQNDLNGVKNEDLQLIDQRYAYVVIVLLILLVIMLIIKKRVANATKNGNKKGSWLFKNNPTENIEIKIIHKKPIDNQNSLLLVEFDNRRYLLMSGNSNVLIDTFSKNDVESDSEFEKVFEENRKKLDDFLKLQERKIDSYKNRVQA